MPLVFLQRRGPTPVSAAAASADDHKISSPMYIVGILAICLATTAVAAWLGLRYYRRRREAKEAANDVGFLSVKGLVPENQIEEKGTLRSSPQSGLGFSRENINGAIPMPEKTLPPRRPGPGASREEILEYHRQSGIVPSTFSAKPFSFALNTSPRVSFASDSKRGSKIRNSFQSITGTGSLGVSPVPNHRFSVYSVMSTQTTASDIQASQGVTRKVRQLFEPVLPDELLLTKTGEQLTIVQSFDDGWCVVGRESSFKMQTSLFKSASEGQENVELGCIPAWCFLKPVAGLRAERPVRSSSLGITVNMDGPASRNDLMSWSNF